MNESQANVQELRYSSCLGLKSGQCPVQQISTTFSMIAHSPVNLGLEFEQLLLITLVHHNYSNAFSVLMKLSDSRMIVAIMLLVACRSIEANILPIADPIALRLLLAHTFRHCLLAHIFHFHTTVLLATLYV